MDLEKNQGVEAPSPEGLARDVIVSPDTRRAERIPPGQSRTRKWPVLDASGPPDIDMAKWRFRLGGLVGHKAEWNWEEFRPCRQGQGVRRFPLRVTRWSRLDSAAGKGSRLASCWSGPAAPLREASLALAHGYDRGWTT